MPQSYDPNLGVLSAFEGVGNAFSDIGKMGMMDAMETRRSKMEQELRLQLQGNKQEFDLETMGKEQDFTSEQAGLEDTRKVKAAKTKLAGDKELEHIKGGYKASALNKELANKEMLSPDGVTAVSLDDVRKLYADANGLNQEMIEWERVEPDFNRWSEQNGFTWRNAQPPAPPKPLDESTYRQRVKESWKAQYGEEIEDEALNEMVKKNRDAGKITGSAPAPVAEPGVMDAMAADAEPAKAGEFAGGEPQGQPGVLSEAEETVAPVSEYDKMGQTMAAERATSTQRKTIQDRLLQHRAKASRPSARPVARKAAKKEFDKVRKAAKQVDAALKKGNIKQVSKDNLKIALNSQSFVDSLTDEELQTLIDYLEQ